MSLIKSRWMVYAGIGAAAALYALSPIFSKEAQEGEQWLEDLGYKDIRGGRKMLFGYSGCQQDQARRYDYIAADGERYDKVVCFSEEGGLYAPMPRQR